MSTQSQTPIEQYAAYPFATDQLYQQGLASILASGTNSPQLGDQDEILRRARTFYFNRVTGNSLTLDEVKTYEHSLPTQLVPAGELKNAPPTAASTTTGVSEATPTPTTDPEVMSEAEPQILTFGELKELIESGRLDQIPNNKTIPEALNEAPPSRSTAPARKKPWEVALEGQSQGQDPAPSTTEGEGAEESHP